MSLKRNTLIISLLICFLLNAQRDEFGISTGFTNYYGDLNQQYRIQPRIGYAQALYKNNRNNFLSIGTSLSIATVQGSDLGANNQWELNRNARFYARLTEVGSFLEINFLPMDKSGKENFIAPYFKTGFGFFSYQAYTSGDSTGVNLSSLNTEGQRLGQNSLGISMYLQYGLGVKFGIRKHLGFGLEGVWKKTSTDYLDDVSSIYPDEDIIRRVYGSQADNIAPYIDTSLDPNYSLEGKQRGSTYSKDDYIFLGVFVTYTINNPKCPLVYD